jgi:opacity protein-like surface antigen
MKKWITATSLVALATIAVAQEAQNQYEPPNAAGAGQKLLAQLTGDWEVAKTFFPSNGKQIVKNGTCKQYMVQDGKFLQSDFTFLNPDGTRSTGAGISGFDPKTNRFTTVWYDSRQTTMSIRQSDGTFDGKNIVLWSTPLDPDRPGRKTVVRAHLEEGGRLLLYRHFLIDDKADERMVFEIRMTRK